MCYLPGTWTLENSRRSLRSHSDMKAAQVCLRRLHCGMLPPTLYRSLVIKLLREHSTTHSCWEQRILSLSIPQCWIQKKYCLWGALESSFSGLSSPRLLSLPYGGRIFKEVCQIPLYLEHSQVNSGCGKSFKVLALMCYSTLMDCTLLFSASFSLVLVLPRCMAKACLPCH